jgi:lysophospholipase L1-like esterase
MSLEPNQKLVFIGDSITDCSRREINPPFGYGYVHFTAAFLSALRPELRLDIRNKGVGGDTIRDLELRWDEDVLEERPDQLFVMIGVNDLIYRHLPGMHGRAVDDSTYEATLDRLLAKTRRRLDCDIVVLEPTPLEEDLHSPGVAPLRALARIIERTAKRHGASVCNVLEPFLQAMERGPHQSWLFDVPHPSFAGHALITKCLLDHLGAW